jgi:hypothetical protein
MTNGADSNRVRTPVHLWVVGILALLWNSMGALDYTMTQTRNAAYLASMTKEQLAYFNAIPVWVTAAWAIGVWGGVVGSLLLLLRKGLAVPVFAASIVGVIATDIYSFLLSNGLEIMGGAKALVLPCLVFVVAIALLFYARAMRQRGVLA